MAPANRSARERIVRTAAELFARRGYHAVGMTELQDAVQLKRGALYHHIRSKDDLLYEIARHYIVELLELATEARGEPDLRRRIERLGSDLVEKIASHQAELTVCFREVQSLTDARRDEVLKLHARYERVWRDAFSEGARAGVFRPFDAVVLKGVLGMYFYSYLWMRASGAMGPAEIATRLNDLALRMLAADARPTAARRSTASDKPVAKPGSVRRRGATATSLATPARRRRASVKVA